MKRRIVFATGNKDKMKESLIDFLSGAKND